MADDPPRPLSVDEVLETQGEQTIQVTLERVPDDDQSVKVTPWLPGRGCLCDAALIVRKDQIAALTPTGETHFCCGEQHTVVSAEFADETLTQVFEQLGQNLARGVPPAAFAHASAPLAPQGTPWPDATRAAGLAGVPSPRPAARWGAIAAAASAPTFAEWQRQSGEMAYGGNPIRNAWCALMYGSCVSDCPPWERDCECLCWNVLVACRGWGLQRMCDAP